MGQKNKFKLKTEEAKTLYKWIGASKFIYNAKIEENDYFLTFGKKFFSKSQYSHDGEFPFFDRTYAQFKNQGGEWLNEVPSHILRDSATIWFRTMRDSFTGKCDRPKRKNRFSNRYVWLCDKLFEFHLINNRWHLEIGINKFYVGFIPVNFPKQFFQKDDSTGEYILPKTLWIKPCRENNHFTVSFCYDDSLDIKPLDEVRQIFFDYAKTLNEKELRSKIEAIDRGVAIPAHSSSISYEWNKNSESSFKLSELKRKLKQQKLARQKKGSKRRDKTRKNIAKFYEKQKNIRMNENHHISKKIVKDMDAQGKSILIAEKLKLSSMTKSAKGSVESPGKNVRAKSSLNRVILERGLAQMQTFLEYKMHRADKVVYYINPKNTSLECSDCGHTHPDNRRTQAIFKCLKCGFEANADQNSAKTQINRAVNYFLDSRTELGKDGYLSFLEDGSSLKGRKLKQKRREKSSTLDQSLTTRQKRLS